MDTLVKAGANLSGSDVEGGFVSLAIDNALRNGDGRAVRIWEKAGAHIPADDTAMGKVDYA